MKSMTWVNRHEKQALAFLSSVVRGLARNIQVYNPTPNSLDVRWDPAPGPVQQYRIVYSPVAGTRPSDSVSSFVILELSKEPCRVCCGRWLGSISQLLVLLPFLKITLPDYYSGMFESHLGAFKKITHQYANI